MDIPPPPSLPSRQEFDRFRRLLRIDFYRVEGSTSETDLLRELVLGEAYKYVFWMRVARWTRRFRVLRWTAYPLAWFMLRHYKYKFGISIPFVTEIGEGFYIGHFGGIVVSPHAWIGRNCNISQGVTIGYASRGKNKGAPKIGDNVYIGPGAKIVGAVRIGHHVAIGANAVVTKDVPDYSVVAGIPAKVISEDGSEGYVNLVDYAEKIR